MGRRVPVDQNKGRRVRQEIGGASCKQLNIRSMYDDDFSVIVRIQIF